MPNDSKTIYVGNIADRVSEEILYELFLQAGPLEKVTIPKDKEGRKRRFAFVTFKHDVSVPYTLQLFEGISLYGRQLNLRGRSDDQDGSSPNMSPGMSPPVMNPNANPNAVSPRTNQGYGAPGQFHKSHTWHGNLAGEGTSGERSYGRQQSGSPSPDSYRQGLQPAWSRHSPAQMPQSSRYGQQSSQGWFNQGSSPMLPPANTHNQSSDSRRQRVIRQQQLSLDAHRQHHVPRHQSYMLPAWQQQSQRYRRH